MSPGRRGGTTEQGREYRKRGHEDAQKFAEEIGLTEDYSNDLTAKKDVIDKSGDAHSVKSGEKKWQIFLYSRTRFETDDGFQALNGVGSLLIHCIDAFPPRYKDYETNKQESKNRLRNPMRDLKDRFQRKALLRAFLMKSIFNGGEVNYLTIYRDNVFHVYKNTDIVGAMADCFTVENSAARKKGDAPEQKVLFKYKGKNVGELEMRMVPKQKRYCKVLFNMNIAPALNLLDDQNFPVDKYSDTVFVYGKAIKTFGNWESS